MNEIVINRPELQAPAARVFFSAVTAVFWTFYLYLMLPLATLIAWYVGFTVVYEEMLMRRGWESLLNLLGVYAIVVLVIGAFQVGWAVMNLLRFRGKRDRRRFNERFVDMNVAEMFLADTTEYPSWKMAKRLVVSHHPTLSKIVSVEMAQ
jgi:biofilm PGA synthesis protein PgaD